MPRVVVDKGNKVRHMHIELKEYKIIEYLNRSPTTYYRAVDICADREQMKQIKELAPTEEAFERHLRYESKSLGFNMAKLWKHGFLLRKQVRGTMAYRLRGDSKTAMRMLSQVLDEFRQTWEFGFYAESLANKPQMQLKYPPRPNQDY